MVEHLVLLGVGVDGEGFGKVMPDHKYVWNHRQVAQLLRRRHLQSLNGTTTRQCRDHPGSITYQAYQRSNAGSQS